MHSFETEESVVPVDRVHCACDRVPRLWQHGPRPCPRARQLAIFDVDGTLTRTVAVDADCFVRALEIEFGLVPPHTDWAAYVHTTDGGIMRELFERRSVACPIAARSPPGKRFVSLLRESAAGDPHLVTATPGAGALLAALHAGDEWDVAIATGAWRTSALFKLRVAGIDIAGLPAAFSDDGEGRDEIVRAVWTRASARPAASLRARRVDRRCDLGRTHRAAPRLALPRRRG